MTEKPGAHRKASPTSLDQAQKPLRPPPATRTRAHHPTHTLTTTPRSSPDRHAPSTRLLLNTSAPLTLVRSTDDGLTWSKPVEITATFDTFKKHYDWKPGHACSVTATHFNNGRLVVPVWLSTGEGGNAHRPSVTATIYSDDQGKSWYGRHIAVPCTGRMDQSQRNRRHPVNLRPRHAQCPKCN